MKLKSWNIKERKEDKQSLKEDLSGINKNIESTNEELRKDIEENSKKMEEETITINQQIREVDERCRLTEGELQEFKEVVNTKVTNLEESSRKKAEENRKESQEELSKVRTQITERCDGMEVVMTNITDQVRLSQEEMKAIRNRPTCLLYTSRCV